jgi:hypothetical protein
MATPTARELLGAYQRQEREFVERRFPLRFEPELPVVRELYEQAKRSRWNPVTDVAWDRFDPARYEPQTLEAARLVWSRRAWSTYPGLSESTALLIRLCLESGARRMDAKLFLSLRPAEEAKHLEACYLFAERLGGYLPDPADDVVRRTTNHPLAQMALDRSVSIAAYLAALGGLDDQLDLNLFLSHLQSTRDEVARQILRQIAMDKGRHVIFAWTVLAAEIPALDADGRAAVVEAVREMLEDVVLSGYRNTWLVPGDRAAELSRAEALTAERGLGASTASEETRVLRSTVAQLRAHLAALGVAVPTVSAASLGTV